MHCFSVIVIPSSSSLCFWLYRLALKLSQFEQSRACSISVHEESLSLFFWSPFFPSFFCCILPDMHGTHRDSQWHNYLSGLFLIPFSIFSNNLSGIFFLLPLTNKLKSSYPQWVRISLLSSNSQIKASHCVCLVDYCFLLCALFDAYGYWISCIILSHSVPWDPFVTPCRHLLPWMILNHLQFCHTSFQIIYNSNRRGSSLFSSL